eukprot:TRINITY_DN14381_c0_g1_i1.p1 TRINITY_DN14381_c0_g1~~TRINITY_DN14381_c0_g1_i1.p1  ORF type:complete len:278 (+),score=119.17 TRINITY_DN14381_c0_g1_i1:150-983(+)
MPKKGKDVAKGGGKDAAKDGKVGSRVVRVLVLIMKVLICVAAVACAGFYGYSIYLQAIGEAVILAKSMAILSNFLHCMLCVFIILAEMGWERFLFEFGFMYTWPGRGMMQLFVAVDFVAQKHEMQVSHMNEHVDAELQALIVDVLGYVLLVVGALYVVMGVANLRGLNDSTEDGRAKRKEYEKRLHKRMTKKQWEEKKAGGGTVDADADKKAAVAGTGDGKKKDDRKDNETEKDDSSSDLSSIVDTDDEPKADYHAMKDDDIGGSGKKKGGLFGKKK